MKQLLTIPLAFLTFALGACSPSTSMDNAIMGAPSEVRAEARNNGQGLTEEELIRRDARARP
jgi:hypothetical protein